MQLRSPAFSDHTLIPAQYSHENGDVSPLRDKALESATLVGTYGR